MNAEKKESCSENLVPRKRILIVDDEPTIRLVLMKRIRSMRPEYDVDSAASAEQALEMLSKKAYEVMVTDLKLPKADGISLAEEVHMLYPDTWSILMTGYGADEVHKNAYHCGCIAYVEKPIDTERLIRWIDHAVYRPVKGRKRDSMSGPVKLTSSKDILSRLVEISGTNEKPWYTPYTSRSGESENRAVEAFEQKSKKGEGRESNGSNEEES